MFDDKHNYPFYKYLILPGLSLTNYLLSMLKKFFSYIIYFSIKLITIKNCGFGLYFIIKVSFSVYSRTWNNSELSSFGVMC